ncbi:LysR family transcriptional regulator [Agarivorans aestuarii]|uniref:LysR family transcriptional regulator n=1 Tax=Agarivorans aestuarii TaxID=1563703 RepID=UPI001C7E22F5|nr:LysR family transcriptional regulator [Agarivorans aestuarii]
MLNPELLKCFVTAAETGSFSQTARVLGKRQSTVSGNIAKLEDDLGFLLFDRTGRYPQLTKQGMALYDSGKLIVDSQARFIANAKGLIAGVPVSFTLAIAEILPTNLLTTLFEKLSAKAPYIQLQCLRLPAQQIIEAVSNNTVQLGFIPSIEGNSDSYEFISAANIPFRLLCGDKHPFTKKKRISNDDLAHSSQVLFHSHKETYLADLAKMATHVWYCQGYELALEAVRSNTAWGFFPYLKQNIEGVSFFTPDFMQSSPVIPHDLIWPKHQVKSHIHQFIEDVFIQEISKLSAP